MAQAIYNYHKKELEEAKILVRINPETFEGLELIVLNTGVVKSTSRAFDETIYQDLTFDSFVDGSALEFNLILKGLSS